MRSTTLSTHLLMDYEDVEFKSAELLTGAASLWKKDEREVWSFFAIGWSLLLGGEEL